MLGLCLLTMFGLNAMMWKENAELEDDFALFLWLCISMNDNLSQFRYATDCVDMLERRTQRLFQVMKDVCGNQRKLESAAGLRLQKFHGIQHYANKVWLPTKFLRRLPRIFPEGQAETT